MKPKILAIYLPQFHETENNNKWWGEGFTDWISVKEATPYFNGHKQPKIPLNGDYYDLANVEVMREQANLAKKYGIDGFVFYHYYFDENDMELYKPIENYLSSKDIDFPFCINWVNESWVRTWSKISGNVWGEKYDRNGTNDDGILKLQKYGGEKEWTSHFNYLLPYFKDDRYIKIDGRPIFIIYAPERIQCLTEMIAKWDELAKKNGLPKLYVIGSNTNSNLGCLDAVMYNEPAYTMNKMKEKGKYSFNNGVTSFDYEAYLNELKNSNAIVGCKTYYTITSGYDTTPRRGRNGECMINYTPDLFYKGLKQTYIKSMGIDSGLVFIDAWNEWGEGMYLEPDEDNGYSYLEKIRKVKKESDNYDVRVIQQNTIPDYVVSEINSIKYEMSKYKAYFSILSIWLSLEQNKKNILGEYLKNNNIKKVAIYGYSDLGRLLHTQLRNEKIDVVYAIDRYVGDNDNGIRIYRVEEDLPYVDMVIITIYGAKNIKENLSRKYDGVIVSLWELFERVLRSGDNNDSDKTDC